MRLNNRSTGAARGDSDSERLWKAFVKGYVEAAKEVEKPTPTQGGSPQFSSRPVLRDLRRSMLRRKMHG
jgi:hypothetical protein